MKLLVVVCAVLSVVTAQPQRRQQFRQPINNEQQPEQPQQAAADQQPAEQNYNNFQSQNYRQQQPESAQQQYRQQDPQEYKKPIEDFRSSGPRTLETTTYIPIIHFDKEQGQDGSYKTSYETGNNIHAQEQGFLRPVEHQELLKEGDPHEGLVQQGSYSYTAPDGQVISVEYTADEFGFRVKGDHIPTPPPVSPEIQKGLDLIYAGIKANAERNELESRNNPQAARDQEDRAALDYKGSYYKRE